MEPNVSTYSCKGIFFLWSWPLGDQMREKGFKKPTMFIFIQIRGAFVQMHEHVGLEKIHQAQAQYQPSDPSDKSDRWLSRDRDYSVAQSLTSDRGPKS